MVKNPSASAGYARIAVSVLELGRSSGVGNGNALQYCCLSLVGYSPWSPKTWTRLSIHTDTHPEGDLGLF